MNKDRVEGKAKDIAGRVERQAGEWTDDPEKQLHGAAKQAEGKVQNAVGKVKDAANKLAEPCEGRTRDRCGRGREKRRRESASARQLARNHECGHFLSFTKQGRKRRKSRSPCIFYAPRGRVYENAPNCSKTLAPGHQKTNKFAKAGGTRCYDPKNTASILLVEGIRTHVHRNAERHDRSRPEFLVLPFIPWAADGSDYALLHVGFLNLSQ
jgi:uncharacterized protein YjbJ (UPF0337 family)